MYVCNAAFIYSAFILSKLNSAKRAAFYTADVSKSKLTTSAMFVTRAYESTTYYISIEIYSFILKH